MITNDYKDGLQQLIAGTITYNEFFLGVREEMSLALCRGLKVDDTTRKEICSLELSANKLGLL